MRMERSPSPQPSPVEGEGVFRYTVRRQYNEQQIRILPIIEGRGAVVPAGRAGAVAVPARPAVEGNAKPRAGTHRDDGALLAFRGARWRARYAPARAAGTPADLRPRGRRRPREPLHGTAIGHPAP